MKFTTLSRRTAAAGAASALVAGALVAATTTAAEAAPIENTYNCDGPTTDFPVILDSDIPLIVNFPEIAAGFDVAAGLLDVDNTFTVPQTVVDGFAAFGVETLEAPNFAGSIGGTNVGVDGVTATVADGVDNGDTVSFPADGLNSAFEIPSAGTYDVLSPDGFTILAKNGSGATVATVPCTLDGAAEPGAYSSIDVFKNDSTSAAKAKNAPVKKGKTAKVGVTVKAPNETPGGKVILKKGKKTLDQANLDNKGKATLSYKAKKVGKNKLKVVYKGDGYTNTSSDKVTVKVVKN